MKYELRPYQLKAKKDTYQSIKDGDLKVINWLDTGAGKGLLMPSYAVDALSRKKKTLVVMRRRDLIFQTRENFKKYCNLKTSIIMGKEKGYDPSSHIQVCSIDTIRNAIKKDEYQYLKDFDIIQIDECHDTTSPSYQKLFDFLGDKIYIGFTATPFETGNKPLLFWDKVVQPIKPSELRDLGFKAPCKFFRPGIIDTTGIKKAGSDFSIKELFEVVSDLKIIGDAIDSYKKYGEDKPFIGFCVNIAHSKLMAHAFNQAGIPCAHIDQSHNARERKQIKDDIESGKMKGVFNVDIFSTGWDCPCLKVLLGLRPTLSEILALQQWGGPLRPFEKEYAVMLDHANNSSRFGFPYDDNRVACLTDFSLDFKKKEARKEENELKVKDCPDCAATIEAHSNECPYCGFKFVANTKEVEHEDGELHEVDQNKEAKIDKRLAKIQSHLNTLINKEKSYGWKPVAKFFMLYDKFGSEIFNYIDELGIPKWIEKAIKKNNSVKKCANCKHFKPMSINSYDTRFNIKPNEIGYCIKKQGDVKKQFFCIQFKGKK